METINLIEEIRSAASVLKNSKLKNTDGAKKILEGIQNAMNLSSFQEPMILVAIFDRQCSSKSSDIEELASYFKCSTLEIMTFVPAIKELLSRNILMVKNADETELAKQKFCVAQTVFSAIIEGREIDFAAIEDEADYDQFSFCEAIDHLIKKRKEETITTKELFAKTLQLEARHYNIPMIGELKKMIGDIEARTLFYEVCNDYNPEDEEYSDINDTLKDMYDHRIKRTILEQHLLEGTHPLISADLIDSPTSTDLLLSEKGIRLLYGELSSVFVRQDTNLNRYEFVTQIDEKVSDMSYNPDIEEQNRMCRFVEKMEKRNPQLKMTEKLRVLLSCVVDRLLFYLVCREVVDSDKFYLRDLRKIFPKSMEIMERRDLKNNRHSLQKCGLVKVTEGGFFEGAALDLTGKGKELFFEEDINLFMDTVSEKKIIHSDKIVEKKLFFETGLQKQLSELHQCLEGNRYSEICERLKARNQPTGIAVLLYGEPGTGKTESVMQIARATGRDIVHVDISATKTCWFGESERLIKEVFDQYRHLCETSEVKPILLFNEADAVFSKRKDSTSGNVAQTENAIQNIILEEMENLDGILIATTNLATNLDGAFDRRFLFKIHFDKSTEQARANIWMDKIPGLSPEDAGKLASLYDFSGGEIDNVARKAAMDEIISGKAVSVERIMEISNKERIVDNTRKIGF